MNTHDVEKMLNISKQTLLYYEKMGFVTPKRNNNNYRNYCQDDIDSIRYVQLLRSFEIPIKDIQAIYNGSLSIKDVLESKKEFIYNSKIELDNIDQKIKDFISRKKVDISFENNQDNNNVLYFTEDKLIYNDISIDPDSIISVNISMSSSQGGNGGYYLFRLSYYPDLDIYLQDKIYSFQIMNNDQVIKMFDYFTNKKINIIDPLDLNQIYHRFNDPLALSKYINKNFNAWAKKYNLDNPRDNYYQIQKSFYIDYINNAKARSKGQVIKAEINTLAKTWHHLITKLFKSKK